METKDWLVLGGVVATFAATLINLYFNLHAGKRTAFVNTVTSERIKWIAKVRDNVARLVALCDRWVSLTAIVHGDQDQAALLQRIEQLRTEIRLQLNPNDAEDAALEKLLDHVPGMRRGIDGPRLLTLYDELTVATQKLLKREWDKVKDEAVKGNLRVAQRSWWRRMLRI